MEKQKNPDEELVGGESESKNWRGILIALVVIVVICGLVIVAVVLVTPNDEEVVIGEPFTLNDLLSPDSEYKIRKFNVVWSKEKNVYIFETPDLEIMEMFAENLENNTIIDEITFRNLRAGYYSVSPDRNYVLLATEIEQIYHHSYFARYWIYDRHSPDLRNNLIQFPMSVDRKWAGIKLRFAGWAPLGHALTFVDINTLYYQLSPVTTPVRVTDEKHGKVILNGVPDWLYEEEILHSNVAHWLSPDGRHVVYIQFNDSMVPLQSFPVYGDSSSVYGGFMDVRYPKSTIIQSSNKHETTLKALQVQDIKDESGLKNIVLILRTQIMLNNNHTKTYIAGDQRPGINPTVKLFVAETSNVKTSHRFISPPDQLIDRDHYITMVKWRDDSHVIVSWANRAQNKSIITICHIVSTDCQLNLVETPRDGRGWSVIEDVLVIRKGQAYLTILPQMIRDTGYWKHICMVSATMNGEGTRTFLTYGEWEVMKIVGYNEALSTVYYLGTNGDPRLRHLFSLKFSAVSGAHHAHQPVCLTCNHTRGDDCNFFSADFSPSGQYYIEGCLGPGIPSYTLKSTENDRELLVENNTDVRQKLSRKALPKKQYFTVKTNDGEEIYGQLFLPPGLKKEHITMYPLLVYTYGGPESQQVTDEFKLEWSTYLTSSENVIYASIDGRGTAGRGNRFLHSIYRNLGTLEVQDQIEAANYLKTKLQYVDKDRIAIWGWSYGGFVTTQVLGDRDDENFKCGIAVAPVTDWRYYDTAYTERYMGMSSSTDNYRGYDNANVSSKAANFKNKGFLLVHGTADDNVHFQNSAQLIKALTEQDIQHQVQVYPDKNHQLPGARTTLHLYKTMLKFLQEKCWKGGKPQDAKPAEPKRKDKA